jgi:hypothetical protein
MLTAIATAFRGRWLKPRESLFLRALKRRGSQAFRTSLVAGLSGKIDHLEQTLSEPIGEQNRKIDLILQHLTGLNNS